jgi:hypothetical protein
MIGNIKALGIAFVAVAAMSMLAGASAQAAEFHVTTGPKANITGENTPNLFDTFQLEAPENAQVQCTQAQFEGTVEGVGAQITKQDITITATYTNHCTAFGLNATIDMNGCKYTLTGEAQPALTARVDIVGCTTITGQQNHKAIEITTAGCTTTVPQQNGLSHITFTNEGAGHAESIEAHVTIQGITYESHGALCPGGSTITTHNGKYIGTSTFQAREHLGTVPAEHNGHKYNKLICGNSVGLFAT